MNEKEAARRANGQLYDYRKVEDDSWMRMRILLPKINNAPAPEASRKLLEQVIGTFPKSATINTPFFADLGHHIHLGQRVVINMDCLFLDEGLITIKDGSMIGPRCCFYTPIHPMDPEVRATGLETALPITVEENVWIGGSCVINGGVTIGKGSVIGSGSVVTHDIEPGVFAVGNPCTIIRKIDEEESLYWKKLYEDYLAQTSVK